MQGAFGKKWPFRDLCRVAEVKGHFLSLKVIALCSTDWKKVFFFVFFPHFFKFFLHF